MRCPACHNMENRVLESRSAESGQSVRRRRECLKCKERFTTYERIEFAPLVVLSQAIGAFGASQGVNRSAFDRQKLLRSIERICERTTVSESEIETLVSSIEAELQQRANREIFSREISELVLLRLRSISEAASIRYASAYCDFENINEFLATLDRVQQASLSAEHTDSQISGIAQSEFAASEKN